MVRYERVVNRNHSFRSEKLIFKTVMVRIERNGF